LNVHDPVFYSPEFMAATPCFPNFS
jgi:hypothetical protein